MSDRSSDASSANSPDGGPYPGSTSGDGSSDERGGAGSTNGFPAGRTDPGLGVRLREQAVEAFGVLQQRTDHDLGPERLRAFLQQQEPRPGALLDALADFARARGLMVTMRSTGATGLTDASLIGDLLLLPEGDLAIVDSIDPGGGSLTVHNFGTGRRERHQAAALADASPSSEGTVAFLHLEGRAPRFLDDGDGAPLHGDGLAGEHDPHDRLDNISETFESLLRLVSDERSDLITITLYAVMVALFALSIPLATQGIIDAVALGTFTSQIVVLCGAIVVGLLLYGAFNMLQYYTVDMLQRRLFAATGLEMAYRIPMMKRSALEGEYGPALINRFFDVITMQKSLAKILLNGLAYALVALTSLLLLAVYSPFFLLIGLLALLFTPILIWGLGRNGLKTSILESSAKYAMAHWLEDLARCQQSFKLNGTASYVHARTDRIASRYVRARSRHFRIFGRQLAAAAVFRALIVGLALGIGGYLATQGDITLGQFVAAELVIVSLTSAGFNIVELFASGYDLLTAISKILHVTEKPLESVGGEAMPDRSGPAPVSIRNVTVGYGRERPALDDISIDIEAGTHVAVVGESGAGKTTLSRTLLRLHELDRGRITFDGHDITRLDLRAYRRSIGLALSTDELFKGTVEENITMGRSFTYPELERALEMAHLEEDVLQLPNGLQTPVTSAGLEFPHGFVRRIMIARAVIGDPRLLILDEAFSGIEEPVKRRLIDRIYGHDAWTLLSIVDGDPTTVRRADRVVFLDKGEIVWDGRPDVIPEDSGEFLSSHFPQLVASLRKGEAAV
jgi:ATP-binding cassette subfamily B protein